MVHAVVLSPYQPMCGGSLPCEVYTPGLNVPSGSSDQYIWLAGDLASVRCTCSLAVVGPMTPFSFCHLQLGADRCIRP